MVKLLAPTFFLLAACAPSKASVTGDTALVSEEDITESDADADGDADSDADADADSDADTDADPEPVPNFDVWEGSRTFYVDYDGVEYDCDGDEVTESGERMQSGSDYETLQDACPECTYIYEVSPDARNACGEWVSLGDPSYRGLIFDGDAVSYVFFSVSGREVDAVVWDDNAGWDGFTVTYGYATEWYYGSELSVEGYVTFPEMMP